MYRLVLLMAFALLVAGCGMAGPGIARSSPPPAAGALERETTYDSRWVKREPDPINSLEQKPQLSVDISKRELGVRSEDMDGKIGGRTVPAHEKRQHDREEARRKAWQTRMGIKTIKDEQEEQEEQDK